MASTTETVKVAVRIRPFNSSEKAAKENSIVDVQKTSHQILVTKPNHEIKAFTFDLVYPPQASQAEVFEEIAKPIVESVATGYNGTIFAYGQTGTGKTFTMEGDVDSEEFRGIMPNTFNHIFHEIDEASNHIEYLVRASFLEIYNDEVFDLLSTKKSREKMQVKEGKSGFYVKDLTMFAVNSLSDTMKVLRKGQKGRQTGATKMNPGSSRSHSIFTITIETCEKDDEGQPHYRVGKLNLVDLAGSERQKKTDATGNRLTEAKNINLSLSALGNVINALVNPNSAHVPFRDSKLTRLLQDSLGGNTKTVMIANVGPAESNFDETMSTLRYANRAKNIKNKPTVNEDPKDAMLRQYQEEIEALKSQLESRKKGLSSAENNAGIQEEVIERVVVKHIGVSQEEVRELEQKAAEENERIVRTHQEECEKILATKTEAEAAASDYEKRLRDKKEQLQKEEEQISDLETMLKSKETHLLVGGKELEKAEKQKQELQKTEKELQMQMEKEDKLQKQMEEAEEAKLYMNDQYSSRQEELVSKTKKLKRLWLRYREKSEDLKDIQDEYDVERTDLIDTIRDLSRQLKLKTTLLSLHVSSPHIELIEKNSTWDVFSDEWRIAALEYAGNNLKRDAAGESDDGSVQRVPTYQRVTNMLSPRKAGLGIGDKHQGEDLSSKQEPHRSNVFFSYGVEIKRKAKGKTKTKTKRQVEKRHKRALGR